ncbi:replication initiator [Cellulosimicrobium sp. RS]|uniref:replication initiator n=1 Tax=Cellulosimicrobium sp. RS TaxID=3381347 RepID=UPI0038FCEF2A
MTYEAVLGGPLRRNGWRRRVRRNWKRIADRCGLATARRVDEPRVIPRLRRVRASGNTLTFQVRARVGQTVDDLVAAAEAIGTALGAESVETRRVGPGTVELALTMRELVDVPTLPTIPQDLDTGGVTLGRRADGSPWRLDLAGRHTLVVGRSGAGKESIFWGIAGNLAPAAHAGLVRLWGVDLKGGVEVAVGKEMFAHVAMDEDAAVRLLRGLNRTIVDRQAVMRGKSRLFEPSPGDPVHRLLIDELAVLTAYASKEVVTEAATLLKLVLTQGRAFGVMVVAFVQDPRKETVGGATCSPRPSPCAWRLRPRPGWCWATAWPRRARPPHPAHHARHRLHRHRQRARRARARRLLGRRLHPHGRRHLPRTRRAAAARGTGHGDDGCRDRGCGARRGSGRRFSDLGSGDLAGGRRPRARDGRLEPPAARPAQAAPPRRPHHAQHRGRRGGVMATAILREGFAGFEGHGPDAPLDLGDLTPAEMQSIAGRSMPALADTLARVGNCAHPVRLVGQSDTIDTRTGEVIDTFRSADQPLGMLYKPCGNRREDVCPACSRIYARDTFELISTGRHGGKGVPDTVRANPLLFVTLTAPSFGPVHGVRDSNQPCRPRAAAGLCPHGRRLTCWAHHDEHDEAVGAPLCPDCYDIDTAAIWQWHAPELWHRFTITLRRHVAAAHGVREGNLRRHVRLEYAKVAEFQDRGLVHFHALIRVDGPDGPGTPSPIRAAALADVVREAAASVACTAPPDGDDVARVLRFGAQTDVRIVRERGVVHGDVTAEQVAAYLAKYSTKSAGADPSRPRPHLAQLTSTCRDLAAHALAGCRFNCAERAADRHPRLCGDCAENPYALLGHWSHVLGFCGHFSTKFRRYSVTLGALRRARRRFQRLTANARRHGATLDIRDLEARLMADDEAETTLAVGSWTYEGTGWPGAGDKALADAAASRAREYARWRADQRTNRPAR